MCTEKIETITMNQLIRSKLSTGLCCIFVHGPQVEIDSEELPRMLGDIMKDTRLSPMARFSSLSSFTQRESLGTRLGIYDKHNLS